MRPVSKSSRLCELLMSNPDLITVVNRFGIYMGVGDATIGEICASEGLDADLLAALLNGYLGIIPASGAESLRQFAPSKIVEYLSKTDRYYEESQIPNIERHFNSLISRSRDEKSNLHLLRGFFDEMKEEMLERIRYDEEIWFPLLLSEDGVDESRREEIIARDKAILDKINDLISFFIIHLRGDYDVNLGRAVVTAVFSLAKDIDQNNRIRSLMY